MTRNLKSEGKCVFCQKSFAKAGISRHLAGHLKKDFPVAKKQSFHLRIDLGPYFLNLLMAGEASLDQLDAYLRGIWLECCGHLSQFSIGRWNDEISKNIQVGKIFSKGAKLEYAYDFGSTTELTIKVLDAYPVLVKESILLLSRNEPLNMKCDRCQKKEAVVICTAHWEGAACFFCEACTEVHEKKCEEAEYAMFSVVNSPRMGVCAYEGGVIDTARD